jgi:Ca2+-binding EF-hand superfamily protein
VTAAAGGLIATVALAATNEQMPAKPDTAPAFEKIDKNQDGTVSKSEAQGSWLASQFAAVDTNHDGSISRAEYQKATS